MKIRSVISSDIPVWIELSKEYDCYVKELVSDLCEWYDGDSGKGTIAFNEYMSAKIIQQEAFMAVDDADNCLGIIVFSKKNNRITFFAISTNADIVVVGSALILFSLDNLDKTKPIAINEIKANLTG